MAFQFSLEAVLRYRRSLEEREQILLQALLVRRAALFKELQSARDLHLQIRTSCRRALQEAATPAVEIQFSTARLQAIERQQVSLQSSLQELQPTIAGQTARYQQERQRREVLDSLRDIQLRDYRMEQQRREQAMLDEMYLLRRNRHRAQFAQ